jgi:hypothetical protein
MCNNSLSSFSFIADSVFHLTFLQYLHTGIQCPNFSSVYNSDLCWDLLYICSYFLLNWIPEAEENGEGSQEKGRSVLTVR